MRRGVVILIVLGGALLAGCGSPGAGGAASQPHTFHVGYGRTNLPDARAGDQVRCPHNGGAGVPASGMGVAGNADFAPGSHGTVSWWIRWAGGGVRAYCRKG